MARPRLLGVAYAAQAEPIAESWRHMAKSSDPKENRMAKAKLKSLKTFEKRVWANPLTAGDPVAKDRWPKDLTRDYGGDIPNLFRFELADRWRGYYSLIGETAGVRVWILYLWDHPTIANRAVTPKSDRDPRPSPGTQQTGTGKNPLREYLRRPLGFYYNRQGYWESPVETMAMDPHARPITPDRKTPTRRQRFKNRSLSIQSGESNLARTLKISDETYQRLNRLAGSLRNTTGRPASMDAAIAHLLDDQTQASPTDFEGAWEMDDVEAKEIARSLDEVWSTWRPGS